MNRRSPYTDFVMEHTLGDPGYGQRSLDGASATVVNETLTSADVSASLDRDHFSTACGSPYAQPLGIVEAADGVELAEVHRKDHHERVRGLVCQCFERQLIVTFRKKRSRPSQQ
ncbi:MAG: hypothetical protein AAGI63_09140 [Planctomycetota bacterium]